MTRLKDAFAPADDSGSGWTPFSGFRTNEKESEGVLTQTHLAPGVTNLDASEPNTQVSGREQDRAQAQTDSESASAMRNASSLGGSLLMTTAVGFLVSILAATLLGPTENGRVATGEAISAIFIGLLSLGFDNYIRREVAIRPSHAKEFVPGAIALRAALTVPITILIAVLLPQFGKPAAIVAIFVVFALARFVSQSNEMLSGCLHAIGEVKGLATQNFIAKLIGGATILGLISLGAGGIAMPIGLLAGEAIKLAQLAQRVGRSLDVWSRTRNQDIKPVLRRSLPFISTVLVTSFTMYLDITLLSFLGVGDTEVGFYKFSQNLALVAFVVGTVLPWVLLPLASRAASQSEAALLSVSRKSIEVVLVLALPMSVFLCLHADTILWLVPGGKYVPSIGSLRVLALQIAVTYLSTLGATLLQAAGRMWITVRVGILVVVLDGILVVATARFGVTHFGPGGAGVAAAWSMLVSELVAMSILMAAVGREVWDSQVLRSAARTVGALFAVILADFAMRRAGIPNLVRALVDVLFFGLNGLLLQIVDVKDLRAMLVGNPEPVA